MVNSTSNASKARLDLAVPSHDLLIVDLQNIVQLVWFVCWQNPWQRVSQKPTLSSLSHPVSGK
jgi:hypothetical protein